MANPQPSQQAILRLAEENGFDRDDFAEEWLWLSLFVIGASIKSARDRKAINRNELAILFFCLRQRASASLFGA
jgi:hypothetical protein